MNVIFPPPWHTRRQARADLHARLAANDLERVAAEDPRWSWPCFGWGVFVGGYLGCLLTVLLAYLWSFYL